VDHHVLVLRPLAEVAFGIGIGRNVEDVLDEDTLDVAVDLSPNCGSIWLSTSRPSNSDHISPTVSSPTRVTTPLMLLR
jgi:hypothetical protein